MTIWIDPPAWPAHGRLWSHLVSDTSMEELHEFASTQGIPRQACEGDHYDVPEERYAGLVAGGARRATGREIVRMLRESGLRIPKMRHERVLASAAEPVGLPPGSRVDTISSRAGNAPANTAAVSLLAVSSRELLVARAQDGALDLPTLPVGALPVVVALSDLQKEVLGDVSFTPFVGYVRQVVPRPTPGYTWPTPQACFPVFFRDIEDTAAYRGLAWAALDDIEGELRQRAWWPLLLDALSRRAASIPARG